MMPLLVNIFGGPGYGKTTLAAGLFVELKRRGVDVEIVSEHAKDLILEGKADALGHQWYVMAGQAYRIMCAMKHMDVVITDSPVMMGVVYDRDRSPALYELCVEHHNLYRDRLDMLLCMKPQSHSLCGRVHNVGESVELHYKIRAVVERTCPGYLEWNTGWDWETSVETLADIVYARHCELP